MKLTKIMGSFLRSPIFISFWVILFVLIIHLYYFTSSMGNANAYGGFLGYIERSLEQIKYELRGVRPVSNQVLIVDMDNKTLDQYGWPLSRHLLAKMVTKLKKYGAKVVAFDVLFSDPSNNDAVKNAKVFFDKFNKISLSSNDGLVKELSKIIGHQKVYLTNFKDRLVKTNSYIYRIKQNLKKSEQKDQKAEQKKLAKSSNKMLYRLRQDKKYFTEAIKKQETELQKYEQVFTQLKTLNDRYAEYLNSKSKELLPDRAFAEALFNAQNVVLGFVGIGYDGNQILTEKQKKRHQINYDVITTRSKITQFGFNFNKTFTLFQPFTALNAPYEDIAYYKKPLSQDKIDALNEKMSQADGLTEAEMDQFMNGQNGIFSTEHFGSFNLIPDIDGIARNYYPVYSIKGEKEKNVVMSLGLAALKVFHKQENDKFDQFIINYVNSDVPELGFSFNMGTKELFQMKYNGFYVVLNYYGPEKTFQYVSLRDIIEDKVDRKIFKDKIILVGTTAEGLLDMRSSPYNPSQRYPGVEVHTTFIENILDGSYFKRTTEHEMLELIALIFIGIFTALIAFKLKLYLGFLLTILLSFGIFYLDFNLFFKQNILLYSFNLIVTPILMFVVATIYRYFSEEKEKKKIKGAFKYYLSQSVVEDVLKDPSKLSLGGVKKDLSVLFSDIRGFTTISEGLTPEQLSSLLNQYLTPMTELVFKSDGTLDKYMGDAVMAFWGAPVEQPDHAIRACLTALEMMKEVERLKQEFAARNLPLIDIGIGVNTGEMSVGNMGSKQRFDYTVMGDHVNLGSRLEGINKQYKTNIIVSEYTYEKVKDQLLCRKLDAVRVKGKKLPVTIYELISEHLDDPLWSQITTLCETGIRYYHDRQWDESIAIFQKVLALKKDDYPSEMYIERCHYFKETPPDDQWDGAFTMTTK